MISFKRILFPVVLSRQSREAAPFVAAMVARFSSELLILHVLEPQLSYYPIPAAATPAAMEHDRETQSSKQAAFELLVSEFFSGTFAHPQVLEGDAAQHIASFARENNVDLIMMPTHGYGPFRRLLLGSVTAKVLHDVECPVWTGVHTDQMWSPASAGWHRFLCAIDEDPRDVPLLKWASQFAREQNVDLKVVHAVHAAAPIAGGESDSLRDFLFGVARETLEKLQADAGTNFDIRLALGPVSHVVREAALEHRADLILIGRGAIQKGLGRLRSNAYATIREAPCPVISL
jgi:nucleotide-binding universal stress UspA family protein